MEALDAILKRVSVREFYGGKPVEEEKAEILLKAGLSAPAACDQRVGQFIVLTDPAICKKMATILPAANYIAESNFAILVCADLKEETEVTREYWQQDLAAAVQNILIAVMAIDLGAVWCGIAPGKSRMDNVSKLLELPDWIKPFGLVVAGYPRRIPPVKDKFDTKRIHKNKFLI